MSDSDLEVTIAADTTGKIHQTPLEPDASGADPSESMTEAARVMRRTSCQNNMKQLMLVIKMFQSEHKGLMTPPGWLSVFPEYLSDRNILTCPGADPHALGYELVFPATMASFFDELAAGVEGVPVEVARRSFQQDIPIAIESKECNGLGGRNVAFLDGHVRYILHEDWNAAVGRYLAYR